MLALVTQMLCLLLSVCFLAINCHVQLCFSMFIAVCMALVLQEPAEDFFRFWGVPRSGVGCESTGASLFASLLAAPPGCMLAAVWPCGVLSGCMSLVSTESPTHTFFVHCGVAGLGGDGGGLRRRQSLTRCTCGMRLCTNSASVVR